MTLLFQNVCQSDQRIVLKGRQNKCEVELRNVRPEDRGQWTCLMTEDKQLETDKAMIDIEVAVPALVRFDPGYGESGILRITEEDVTEVNQSHVCLRMLLRLITLALLML